jgi:hypothetical protein
LVHVPSCEDPDSNTPPPGYDQATLAAAATAAGQDASSGTILFDSIYNCGADGVIAWNRHCDNGCDPAISVPNANCRA